MFHCVLDYIKELIHEKVFAGYQNFKNWQNPWQCWFEKMFVNVQIKKGLKELCEYPNFLMRSFILYQIIGRYWANWLKHFVKDIKRYFILNAVISDHFNVNRQSILIESWGQVLNQKEILN